MSSLSTPKMPTSFGHNHFFASTPEEQESLTACLFAKVRTAISTSVSQGSGAVVTLRKGLVVDGAAARCVEQRLYNKLIRHLRLSHSLSKTSFAEGDFNN